MLEDRANRATQPTHRSRREQQGYSPYWLVVRDQPEREIGPATEVFILNPKRDGHAGNGTGDGAVLPVFSSDEEATTFLLAMAGEGGWRTRRTGDGELVSMLSGSTSSAGPCTGIEKVALDAPAEIADGPELDLVTIGRQCFLENLTVRGRAWFEELAGIA